MLEIRLLEARGGIAEGHRARHLRPRVPHQAAAAPGAGERRGEPPVLLIDEIDRADEEFEAYLLEMLSDFQVTVPEIGTIRAERPPLVVVASNRTREVHDALKRRCLYHWIDYPTVEKELEIVRGARAPRRRRRSRREIVAFVHGCARARALQDAGRRRDARLGGRAHGARPRGLGPESSTTRWACCSSTRTTSARCAARRRPATSASSRRGPEAARVDVRRPPDPPLRGVPVAEVSGRTFLAGHALLFAWALRRRGIYPTDLGGAIDFTRALTIIDIGDRTQVHAAGSAIFVRRRDDLVVYDEVFAQGLRWPRAAGWRKAAGAATRPRAKDHRGRGRVPRWRRGEPARGAERTPPDRVAARRRAPAGDEEEADGEATIVSPRAYSAAEAFRHREFERMTTDEIREAERFIDLLRPRLESHRTRRQELHPHRRKNCAPRAMMRRNLKTGGDLVDWVWRGQTLLAALDRGDLRRLRLEWRHAAAACSCASSMPSTGRRASTRRHSSSART